jgi:CheY-like chemotaxis protein
METLALSGIKVLSVDDALDNQLLVQKILQRHGALVETAVNGAEGYEKAIAGEFDVVLMDIQMPVLDGYRATEMLREYGFTRPIIAVTAFASPQDREKCLSAGCDAYMPKPINSVELVQMILQRSIFAESN